FKQLTRENPRIQAKDGPIQTMLVPGNQAAQAMENKLQAAGLHVRAIRSPSVPAGKERLRICLHSYYTEGRIRRPAALLEEEKTKTTQAMKPLFVTGIDTGIGKTIVSAILVEKLQADYWKPVQSGDLERSDTMMVRSLVSNGVSR